MEVCLVIHVNIEDCFKTFPFLLESLYHNLFVITLTASTLKKKKKIKCWESPSKCHLLNGWYVHQTVNSACTLAKKFWLLPSYLFRWLQPESTDDSAVAEWTCGNAFGKELTQLHSASVDRPLVAMFTSNICPRSLK